MSTSNEGMHEHDLDLIAALADGSAGEAGEAAEARALVETCPVCRAEYEAQTEVIAWLAAAPSPVMTDLERAGLHRAVRSGLGSETTPAPSAPWWQRLGYVAAGLLVVAGLFGVLQNSGMMMGGGDESASLSTTTAADGADAPAGGLPFVAEDAEEAAAPTTTAAASADTMAAAEGGATIPFAALAEEARMARSGAELDATTDEQRECLARAGLDRHIVVDEVEAENRYLVVVPEQPSEDDVVIFVELPDCRVVFEDR